MSCTSLQSLIRLPSYGRSYYETKEKCDTIIIDTVTVYGTLQGMCHLSRGIIAQSLSMKTNTDM